MSDEEVIKFYNELEEHYGDRLVNFEHHPRQFAHQVLLYRYYINKESNTEQS
jgi:hypothetical protein